MHPGSEKLQTVFHGFVTAIIKIVLPMTSLSLLIKDMVFIQSKKKCKLFDVLVVLHLKASKLEIVALLTVSGPCVVYSKETKNQRYMLTVALMIVSYIRSKNATINKSGLL
jgi:hypothetical protein